MLYQTYDHPKPENPPMIAITKNKRVDNNIRITSLSFLGESCQGLFLAPMVTNTIPPARATPPKMGGNGMVFLVSLSTAVTRSPRMTILSKGSFSVGARACLIHIHLLTIEMFSISPLISSREILRCFGHSPCVLLLSDRGFFSP